MDILTEELSQVEDELLTIKEASEWASQHVGREVSTANISYLVQYGRVKKISGNGPKVVSKQDLVSYYRSFNGYREVLWKNQLGDDLNWILSFDKYREAETTKHVHRLHPYKGKFIPQLVEYFLDDHIDNFKTESYFQKGDIILDPFSGSGTTMVQASELGMHAIGVDVSAFNSLMSNCKVARYDLRQVRAEIVRTTDAFKAFLVDSHTTEFEGRLVKALYEFNTKFFPVPDYKYRLRRGEIQEAKYGPEKEKEFLQVYHGLIHEYGIKLLQENPSNFLDKWYLYHIRREIEFLFAEINKIDHTDVKQILSIILSRTIRSCRATTHADLATLVEPVTTTYYCAKHGKICKPLFSILRWWETYTRDTLSRLIQFDKLRTHTLQVCLTGDSKTIDLLGELRKKNSEFADIVEQKRIRGIFSSPPYVGLIDYHEQHAYSYDLFAFERRDDLEIGPLSRGQGKEAKESYISGITEVLVNSKKFLVTDFDIFLVANDKFGLYPRIAENAGMKIINQFRRPVLNRTEKDKGAYSESIFHLKAL